MSSKSRHQPKERQDHQNSSNTHNQPEEKSTKRHVYIEPGVQIDIVQDLKKQHQAERQEDTAAQKKQLLWTKVTAGLVIAYTSVMIWQACLTRQSIDDARHNFNAYYRPFIGVNGVAVNFAHHSAGKTIADARPTPESDFLTYVIEVKNFGPVPGSNYVGKQRAWFGGKEVVKRTGVPDQPIDLFPGKTLFQIGSAGGQDYADLVSGKKQLRIELTLQYDGPAGHYGYCETEQYDPDSHQFMNLGACTSK